MEQWIKISLVLCIFGFIKEIRPSEPFTYEYLIGPWKDLTEDEILKKAFPVSTYSNLIWLVIIFLITDMCRYKPLIIVLGLSGIVVWSMLIWTSSLVELIIIEATYGLFRATEVAYYSYIYAKVDRKHYQKVTSHTRGALLAGRCISGISSQVFVSTKIMDYKQLNYVSLASVGAASIWALFLPPVNKSLYFHSENSKNQPISKKIASAFGLMKSHFVNAYTNKYVVKWSLWWALSTCGYVQVEFYLQPLYSTIQDPSDTDIYNGAVEAIITLLGFLAALLAGYLKFNWKIKGEVTLGLFSLIQGILIVVISQTKMIFLCYSFYILFGILYHFMITIASAEIAKKINEDSYGLIFGINMFVSLVFNSILTVAVATEGTGFALDPRGQYIVYGGYHLIISVIFIIMGLWTCFSKKRTRNMLNVEVIQEKTVK